MEAPHVHAGRARVLVVDDEASDRDGLRALLRGEGFVVACAADGQQALDVAPGFDPDVVLTDLHMPRLDGIELCVKLHELDPELPVILLTVHDDDGSILRGLRAGVEDYLPKPLDGDLVLWSLRRAIARRATHIEQRQLRAHNDQLLLEAQAMLERYDEVRAVVSHDLRNPLAIGRLTAERLLEEWPEISAEARTAVDTIIRSIARSAHLVDNLLDDARLRGDGVSLERRDHAIDELLGDVIDLRPLALQRGVRLEVERSPTQRTLSCDRVKMAQVLSNLVGNAIKFSPKGETVRVWADDGDREISFAVGDHGPGIPADARPHLFERFWHSPGRTLPGLGLGLYIAKGIVDAHGGRIWVDSPAQGAGRGSTFFVSLPAEPGR